MNTPVSFELAKLLKEKGFVCNESNNFWMNGFSYSKKDYNPITYRDKDNVPTIAEVVMWLYEKHGIWIAVVRFKDHASDNNEEHTFRHTFLFKEYKSPTEAYEGAIEYTLTNLL